MYTKYGVRTCIPCCGVCVRVLSVLVLHFNCVHRVVSSHSVLGMCMYSTAVSTSKKRWTDRFYYNFTHSLSPFYNSLYKCSFCQSIFHWIKFYSYTSESQQPAASSYDMNTLFYCIHALMDALVVVVYHWCRASAMLFIMNTIYVPCVESDVRERERKMNCEWDAVLAVHK